MQRLSLAVLLSVGLVGCRSAAEAPIESVGSLQPAPVLREQQVADPEPAPVRGEPGRVIRRVAVFGTIENPTQHVERDAFLVSVKEALARSGAFEVVTRRHVAEIEFEQRLAEEGRLDERTIPELGRIHGTSYLLEAVREHAQGDTTVRLLLLDVETSAVVASGVATAADERVAILAAVDDLAAACASLPLKPGDLFESR